MKYYKKKCLKCKERAIHKIIAISRSKGYKLQCSGCLNSKWYNYQDIKQFEVKTLA